MTNEKQISLENDGQVVAQATVSVSEDTHDAWAQVNVAAGHVPPGTRRKMADAVHEAVVEDQAQHLTATVPLGDAELVQGLREHLEYAQLRAAGATSIIEGQVKPG